MLRSRDETALFITGLASLRDDGDAFKVLIAEVVQRVEELHLERAGSACTLRRDFRGRRIQCVNSNQTVKLGPSHRGERAGQRAK